MKNAESDPLNSEDGENGSSYLLESPKNNGFKTPKSMDDDGIDNENSRSILTNLPPKEEFIKKTELTRTYDYEFDSDDDTFADAESDCEPNHFFLNEMLEDEHPERLNLFDYRKKEQEKDKGSSSRTLSSSDTQNDEHAIDESSTTGHDESDESGHDRLIRNLNINSESESATEESDDKYDSFGNLPTIRKHGNRGRLSMGASPGAGPGRAMLRQASQKAVWGK